MVKACRLPFKTNQIKKMHDEILQYRVFSLCYVSDGGLCEEKGPTQTLGIGRVMQWLKDGG